MQEQISEKQFQDCGGMIMEVLNQMPVHGHQLMFTCSNHPQKHLKKNHSPQMIVILQKRFTDMNRQAIENKFILMIDKILCGIEVQLKKQDGDWKKFQQFEHIFIKNLDEQIYRDWIKKKKSQKQKNKAESTPKPFKSSSMGSQYQKADHADQFFGQLFEVMHELLGVMKQHYGYQDDEQIQIAMYTALIDFIQNNQSSFIAEEDRLSMSRIMVENQNKQEMEQQLINLQEKKQEKSYFKMLEDFIEPSSIKQRVQSLPGFIVEALSNRLAYFSKKSDKAQKLKSQLTQLLKKKPADCKLSKEQETLILEYIKYDIQALLTLMPMDCRSKFIQFISDIMTESQCQEFLQETGAHIELSRLVQKAYEIQKQKFIHEQKNIDQIFWILLIYKAFEDNYCPSRRQYLISICKRPQLKQKSKNPIQILKFIQSQNLTESLLLKLLRKTQVHNKNKEIKKLGDRSYYDDLTLQLQKQIQLIHLYQFKKKYELPIIQFSKLSECPPRKNITFLFSGFLSEDSDKLEEWSQLVKTGFDSEIYSIRWESKSLQDMLMFLGTTAKDIVTANLGIGAIAGPYGPYLKAAAIVRQLYIKYQQNPFNPAFQKAAITGYFIAELLINNFQGHFINLVGFSLGTEVIKSILVRLQEKKQMHLINRVYFLGGVVNKPEIEEILANQKHILRIRNMHSQNDYILKYLLKLCKTHITPIGLTPINEKIKKHKIKNVDGSELVGGHLAYRDNLSLIELMMEIHD